MRRVPAAILLSLVLAAVMLAFAGCTPGPQDLKKAELEESEHGQFPPEGEEAKHQVAERHELKVAEVLSKAKKIPEEAAEEHNPVPLTDKNVEAGRLVYDNHCSQCHGVAGFGDGEDGSELSPKPTDLHEEFVQLLPDGGLYWLIAKGIKGTAMTPFENRLHEEELWQLVNYLRTFGEHKSPALVE